MTNDIKQQKLWQTDEPVGNIESGIENIENTKGN